MLGISGVFSLSLSFFLVLLKRSDRERADQMYVGFFFCLQNFSELSLALLLVSAAVCVCVCVFVCV